MRPWGAYWTASTKVRAFTALAQEMMVATSLMEPVALLA